MRRLADVDYVLYWSKDRHWHVFNVSTGIETYHEHFRLISGSAETLIDVTGILALPGKPAGALLVRGKIECH